MTFQCRKYHACLWEQIHVVSYAVSLECFCHQFTHCYLYTYRCSAVRIPTIRAHSEVIIIETEKPVDVAVAQRALMEAPGVKLVDDPSTLSYPMPLTVTGQYDVEVGRLRKSLVFGDYGLEFFVSGDQLLRGAALNAVLVAEEMHTNGALAEFKAAVEA